MTVTHLGRGTAQDCAPIEVGKPTSAGIKEYVADEAKRIVTGARRSAYGTPEDNFARIAKFWQAYFENTGRPEAKITAQDISPLMRLMKEARLCESPQHLDSFVDLVGYTLTGAEVNGVSRPSPEPEWNATDADVEDQSILAAAASPLVQGRHLEVGKTYRAVRTWGGSPIDNGGVWKIVRGGEYVRGVKPEWSDGHSQVTLAADTWFQELPAGVS